jgi:hypothetical protein
MTAVRTAEPGTARLLARTVAAEWTRLWSVRTTWWCILAAAATIVGIGATAAFDVAGEPVPVDERLPGEMAGHFGMLPGQFALLLLVLLAVTPEYATRSIGTTLQWTPRRGVLFVARVAVPVVVATVVGVLLTLLTDLAAWAIAGPVLELSVADLAESLGKVAFVLAAGALLAVGAGFFLRSTAGALATVFLLLLVLPLMLPAFGVQWMVDLARLLPGSGTAYLLLEEPEMTTASSVAVLTAWAGGALVAGGWSLLRRDAV